MADTPSLDLDALAAAAEAVEWSSWPTPKDLASDDQYPGWFGGPADAAYFAALRPDVVLRLIEEVRRLRDEGAALEDQMRNMRNLGWGEER